MDLRCEIADTGSRWACQNPPNKAAWPALRGHGALSTAPPAGVPAPCTQGLPCLRPSVSLAGSPAVVSIEKAQQVTRMACEISVSHPQGPRMTGSQGRGSLCGSSPGRVARVPSLDISVLQGQICADQIELLILRKGEGQVGAAGAGGRTCAWKGQSGREMNCLGESCKAGHDGRTRRHRASLCGRGLHHTWKPTGDLPPPPRTRRTPTPLRPLTARHGPQRQNTSPRARSHIQRSTPQTASSGTNLTFSKVSLAKPGEQNYEMREERAGGLAGLGQGREAALFGLQGQGVQGSFLLLPF